MGHPWGTHISMNKIKQQYLYIKFTIFILNLHLSLVFLCNLFDNHKTKPMLATVSLMRQILSLFFFSLLYMDSSH